ncbi:XRE family transcriptional regulator [Macrococcoides bohemicum]|uniref:helix-turn-helix domain-containing protein n=1 Tax=Macrococcoides bohemicum TaxID=1903056 RepID=UPI001059B52A|nr:helix-turn-helix transcriptional regulator [Macrococcus bohemicus]TDL40754.1 XRE family transcriptional regulator [Macrococcus bohemicus]
MSNEFGNFIKELRGKKSIRETAKNIGISHTYLSTLEKGIDPRSKNPIKPTIDAIDKIATYYKIDRMILLDKAGYKSFVKMNDLLRSNLRKNLIKHSDKLKKENASFVYNELLRLADNDLKEYEIDFLNSSFKFMNVSDINENLYIASLFTQLKVDKEKKHNSDTIKEIAQEISTDIDKFVIEYLKPGKSDLSELGFDEYE